MIQLGLAEDLAGTFKFLERVYGLALQAQSDDVPLGYAVKHSE